MNFRHFLESTERLFYWVPSDAGRPIQPGWRVPARRAEFSGIYAEYTKVVEQMFEKVRQEVAPQAPSRLHAIFLCPDVSSAAYYKRLYKAPVYEVTVEGSPRMVTVDGGRWGDAWHWTIKEAIYAKKPLTLEDAYRRGASYAKTYWLGDEDGFNENPEVLVDPAAVVTVVRQVG